MSEKSQPPIMITRFAPSPTGLLHLGHAYSALLAQNQARQAGGRLLLRIEDIDPLRCHSEFEAAIFEDLGWLGLSWEQPVRRQSDHMDTYKKAVERLEGMGLLYPCFCSRKDIRDEIAEAGRAPHQGPEGPHYPGICRVLTRAEVRERREACEPFALRLDHQKALSVINGPIHWHDTAGHEITAHPQQFGDVVLARKDIPTSYHLSVTIDDDLQGVNLVSRGEDLLPSTDIHRLLQELLGLSVPTYHHHPLLSDKDGRRLAKRHRSKTIKALREAGNSPEEVRAMAGL
jgi:glutamyl-Q tRNA(Asp) synthetase